MKIKSTLIRGVWAMDNDAWFSAKAGSPMESAIDSYIIWLRGVRED